MASKYYTVLKPLTYKGKFKHAGYKIRLTKKESEVLINKNLVK